MAKTIHLTKDIYARVMGDGGIYIGNIDAQGKSHGTGMVLEDSMNFFNYGQVDDNFAIKDDADGLSMDDGEILIARDGHELMFTKYNFFCALANDMKGQEKHVGVIVNCNAISSSAVYTGVKADTESVPLVEVGEFSPHDHHILKGIVVSSCQGVKMGEFKDDTESYTITKGINISSIWPDMIANNWNSCSPLVSIGDFVLTHNCKFERLTKGIMVRGCGAIQAGMFSKEGDALALGMKVHGCNFFKDPYKVFCDVDIGMFDKGFLKAGVMWEETFFTGLNKFSNTGRWINENWQPGDRHGTDEGAGGRVSTMMMGVFEKNKESCLPSHLKGLMVKSNGTFRVGKFDFIEGDITRGIEVTPDSIHYFGTCGPQPPRRVIKQ